MKKRKKKKKKGKRKENRRLIDFIAEKPVDQVCLGNSSKY